jgi:hypothetical protein
MNKFLFKENMVYHLILVSSIIPISPSVFPPSNRGKDKEESICYLLEHPLNNFQVYILN